MVERSSKTGDVLRSGEGDDGDTTPGCLNLHRMHTQLRQVILAEEAAKMAEKHEDGRASQQAPGGKRVAGRVAEIEIELDSRHRDLG